MAFNSPYTPAGQSPSRPIPSVGDNVKLVQLPACDNPQKLTIGEVGVVEAARERSYWVRFRRYAAWCTPQHIEVVKPVLWVD
jgi:hypothetical protein